MALPTNYSFPSQDLSLQYKSMRSIVREQRKWSALKRSSRRLRKRHEKTKIDLRDNPFCVDRQLTDKHFSVMGNTNPRLLQKHNKDKKYKTQTDKWGETNLLYNKSPSALSQKKEPWKIGSSFSTLGKTGGRTQRFRNQTSSRNMPKAQNMQSANIQAITTFGHRPSSAARMYDPLSDSVRRQMETPISVDSLMSPEEIDNLLQDSPRGVKARLQLNREKGWHPQQLLTATKSMIGVGGNLASPFSIGLSDDLNLEGPKFMTSALRRPEAYHNGVSKKGRKKKSRSNQKRSIFQNQKQVKYSSKKNDDGINIAEKSWNNSIYHSPKLNSKSKRKHSEKSEKSLREKILHFRKLQRSPFRGNESPNAANKRNNNALIHELTSTTILSKSDVNRVLRKHSNSRMSSKIGDRGDESSRSLGRSGSLYSNIEGSMYGNNGYAGVDASQPPHSLNLPDGVELKTRLRSPREEILSRSKRMYTTSRGSTMSDRTTNSGGFVSRTGKAPTLPPSAGGLRMHTKTDRVHL